MAEGRELELTVRVQGAGDATGGDSHSLVSSSTSPGKGARRRARRMLYPVGRVLHMLPAHVAAAAAADAQSKKEQGQSDRTGGARCCDEGEKRGTRATESKSVSPRRRVSFMGESESRAHTGCSASPDSRGRSPRARPASAGSPDSACRQEHSGDERVGSAACRESDEHDGLLERSCCDGEGAATHVMVEDIPVTAYDRVILCSTMLSDHFLPRYMTALDAVIHGLAGPADS